MQALEACAELRLQLRIASEVLPGNAGKPEALWTRTVTSAAFAPHMSGAVDLVLQ